MKPVFLIINRHVHDKNKIYNTVFQGYKPIKFNIKLDVESIPNIVVTTINVNRLKLTYQKNLRD